MTEMTEITMAEVGAPQAACDVAHLGEPLKFLPYYADLAESFEWTTPLGIADTVDRPQRWTEREPIGVVAAITPWNVPTQINLAKTAPALAAGCTVVLKPAPQTPWSALALGRLVTEHTDIPGCLQRDLGRRPTIGALLTEDHADMIPSPARRRRENHHASGGGACDQGVPGTRGKSAMILLDDLDDVSGPADGCVRHGACLRAGLRTLDPHPDPEVEVRRDRHRHRRTLRQHHARPTHGRGHHDGATHRSPTARSRRGLCASALDEGARIVCGGLARRTRRRRFYLPTLLADVTPEMRVAREEIFGPVLVAIPRRRR